MSNTTAPYAIEQGEQIVIIPWDHLHDSKKQYRKRYPEAYIKDLSANIKAVGRISSPLLVRPIVPELFQGSDDANAVAGYEVISGHCRKRAGMLAELPGGPCIIRKMTDAEAALIMISENLQRKDVHPIEEAEGFADMMKEHGKSADELAAEFGVSRSYIYGRLKLLQACPKIRDACLDEKISAEVALLIARLRTPQLQQKALSRIEGKYISLEDGGQKSVRQVRELLKEHFTLTLKDAIFPIEDASLLPAALPCGECPKRSGNAPEYTDLASERESSYRNKIKGDDDLCTDPDCFEAKKRAHLKREAEKLEEAGKMVIQGHRARASIDAQGQVKGAYVALKDVRQELAATKASSLKAGALPPSTVLIQDPRTGKTVEAVAVEALKKVGVKVDEAAARAAASKEESLKREQERKAEATRKATELNKMMFERVREAVAQRPRDAVDLALVAMVAVAGVGYKQHDYLASLWGCQSREDLKKKVGSLSVADLNRLLMDCALIHGVVADPYDSNKGLPSQLSDTAKRYGVSFAPPAAPVQTSAPAGPTPSTAAQAQGKGTVKSKARYVNAATGETWSGRGLQPAWMKKAIREGGRLEDFDTSASPPSSAAQAQGKSGGSEQIAGSRQETEQPAGSAGDEVKVEAGGPAAAGGAPAAAETGEEAVA